MKRLFTTCIIAACLLGARADAQAPTTDAALRYWMAFAVMHDPPAGQAAAGLLGCTPARAPPWDDAKLGKALGANSAALEMMPPATELTTSDWGPAYGPRPHP